MKTQINRRAVNKTKTANLVIYGGTKGDDLRAMYGPEIWESIQGPGENQFTVQLRDGRQTTFTEVHAYLIHH